MLGKLKRDEVILQTWRFTGISSFVRELTHLLEYSDYRIEAHVLAPELEGLAAELGMLRAIGRLTVTVVQRPD